MVSAGPRTVDRRPAPNRVVGHLHRLEWEVTVSTAASPTGYVLDRTALPEAQLGSSTCHALLAGPRW